MTDPVSRAELKEFTSMVERELLRHRESIDALRASRYTPFFGTAGLFLVVTMAIGAHIKSINDDLSTVEIKLALAINDAMQYQRDADKEIARHIAVHRRDREAMDRLREFVKAEYGIVVKEKGE